MIVFAFVAGLIAVALLYQTFGAYRDAKRFPALGRVIDVGPCRLHLNVQGAGSPTVVLESGIAASSLSWALVQPEIAKFTRVAGYDRAGLGWSQRCSVSRTVEQMILEMSSLLSKAGLRSPYILVGHSFGGLLVRAYANLKPNDVVGLVLVDPVSVEYWANCGKNDLRRLQLGTKFSRRGAVLARFGIVRATLDILASGGRKFPKLIARASAGRGTTVLENMVGQVQKLPPEVWPMIRAHWSRSGAFLAMAGYLAALPESARAALHMPIPSHIPLMILSASTATEQELKERDSWIQQSERGTHIRLNDCGHWIQLEQPEAVIAAVRQLIEGGMSKR